MIPLAWRLGGAAALLAAAAGGAYWWGASRYAAGDAAGRAAERAVWQDAVAEQGRRFGLAVAAQADVLVAAEGQLEVVRGQRSRFRVVTREVIRDDPAAADWSRIPVPDQLRRAAGAALGLPTDPGEPAGGLF